MAEASGSIFNKRATEKLRNPDDLDKYVRVTNPSIWAVLGACFLLLGGVLAWGVFGAVSTTQTVASAYVDDRVIGFISPENVSEVSVGDTANVDGQAMRVSDVGTLPISKEEAKEILESDYLVSVLLKDEYAYIVSFEGTRNRSISDYGFTEFYPMNAVITTDRVAPISFVLNV